MLEPSGIAIFFIRILDHHIRRIAVSDHHSVHELAAVRSRGNPYRGLAREWRPQWSL